MGNVAYHSLTQTKEEGGLGLCCSLKAMRRERHTGGGKETGQGGMTERGYPAKGEFRFKNNFVMAREGYIGSACLTVATCPYLSNSID